MVDNFKVDLSVKERRNNFWKPVDELHGLDPDEAVVILNSKYTSASKDFDKSLKSILVKNTDSFIKTYKEFFDLRKKK